MDSKNKLRPEFWSKDIAVKQPLIFIRHMIKGDGTEKDILLIGAEGQDDVVGKTRWIEK